MLQVKKCLTTTLVKFCTLTEILISVFLAGYIRPICLPVSMDLDNRLRNTKPPLTVVGWGVTENNTQSNVKLKVDVGVM